MTMFSWLAAEDSLSSAVQTVRAQAVSPTDAGRILHPAYFPAVDTSSTRLDDISAMDFRPVSDRREWNTRGRAIPLKGVATRMVEMIPIESYFKVDEQEIQRLLETVGTNQAQFRTIIGARIPDRVIKLAEANIRRIEVDAFSAWANGSITVKNPQGTGTDRVVSLGFAAGRYVTAGTAWNDAGVNAYNLLIAALDAAEALVGPVQGAIMRRATFLAIQADAPTGAPLLPLTMTQIEDRVTQDRGRAFKFTILEESHDIFTDGGLTTVSTKVWPAHKIAFVPEGGVVGSTYYAPVARGFELVSASPEAKISVNRSIVYIETSGNGREITVECQVNALPLPTEQKLYVVDAGV